MQSRWRVCLKKLLKKRLGPVAGESQPFIDPITGKNCKTCVLTWKFKYLSNNPRPRVHRFRSYIIENADMEGSAGERNCPIWKVAWIAIHDIGMSKGFFKSDHTLGNDHMHRYTAIERGYCRTDNEAYDEMVHIWESIDDSCFVSIEPMRKEEFSDRYPLGSALWQGWAQSMFEGGVGRPDLLEMSLPESATLHRFGFRVPFQIKPGMWEAWDQVLKEYNESKPKPPKHIERIVNCAVRLFGAPCSNTGVWLSLPFLEVRFLKQTKADLHLLMPYLAIHLP